MRVMEHREFWPGTASELLRSLETHAGDDARASKSWPKSPRSLSTALRRIGPQLRMVGMIVEFDRSRERFITITGTPEDRSIRALLDQPIGALG